MIEYKRHKNISFMNMQLQMFSELRVHFPLQDSLHQSNQLKVEDLTLLSFYKSINYSWCSRGQFVSVQEVQANWKWWLFFYALFSICFSAHDYSDSSRKENNSGLSASCTHIVSLPSSVDGSRTQKMDDVTLILSFHGNPFLQVSANESNQH